MGAVDQRTTRRVFLRRAGGSVVAASLAGQLEFLVAHTSAARPPWDELAAKLGRKLIRPGDRGYAQISRPLNLRYAGIRPGGVAVCSHVEDVQTAVAWAQANGVQVAVRSGGHNYAGYCTGPGLVVNVGGMRGVAFDARHGPRDRTARRTKHDDLLGPPATRRRDFSRALPHCGRWWVGPGRRDRLQLPQDGADMRIASSRPRSSLRMVDGCAAASTRTRICSGPCAVPAAGTSVCALPIPSRRTLSATSPCTTSHGSGPTRPLCSRRSNRSSWMRRTSSTRDSALAPPATPEPVARNRRPSPPSGSSSDPSTSWWTCSSQLYELAGSRSD